MKRVLMGAGMVFTACGMFGQPTVPAKAFEVASIKLNTSDSGDSSTSSGNGRITMTNVSLKQCIETAFAVKDSSFSGPSWLDSVKLDIVAKAPADSTPPGPGSPLSDFPAMLQTLLADRFKLQVHRETKVLSGYALIVDKKGLKIQPAHPVEEGRSTTSSGRGQLSATGVSLEEFADLLSSSLDRPVKDLTEIHDVFDLKLKWTPDGTLPADSPTATSLFAAVQEQLGLRLEARKLPIEILVVDHAEKVPTEN
jgi:uncharacterized protein (TIGR03435 family)